MAFAFDDFELDEELYELRQRGERVAIRPQALDVLFHLVRHRERVVTKDELLGAVWGGVAVSETALPQAILAVRRALGDDGDSPRLVQTIRARGYRFLGASAEPLASVTSLPFVGRHSLLRRARELVTHAAAGQGGAMSVSGGVGAGKTRALLEIATIAHDAGAVVVTGRCHDEEGVPPLWPWLAVLRALEIEWNGEPDGRFFDVVVRALGERAKRAPLVVLLDDLQSADHGTLLLFKLVAQSFRSVPALVVGAYRDSAMSPVMARTAGAIAREDPSRCVTLEPFDAAAIALLGNTALARPMDQAAIDRVHTKTGGCPLFVVQMLHALRTQDGDRSTSAMLALDTMREAIGHHLGALSEDCRAVLAASSVFPESFTVGTLAAVLERRPEETLEALDEAVAHKILVRIETSTYRFVHQLVRDVLYKKLGSRERFALHERAARALRDTGDEGGASSQAAKASAIVG